MLITLGRPGSCGVIDYEAGNVNVEFYLHVTFPELFEILNDMGADPDLTAPVEVIVRSHGVVFEDHSFRLAGKGKLTGHRLFDRDETKIDILAPTRCRPDVVSRTGEEIHAALINGESVSWNFNPTERRVILVLPESLGGRSHELCLAGSYTFTAIPEGSMTTPATAEAAIA